MTSTEKRSLADMVFETAARHPTRMAIRTEDDCVSYAMLRELIINYALHLRANGVSRASCVGVETEHPIIAMILPLSCSLLGCAWVHMTRAATAATQMLGITHHVHDGTMHQTERRGVLRITQHWSEPPNPSERRERSAFPGYARPERTWMIAQSSGTTGIPKFMALNEQRMWLRIVNPSPVRLPDPPLLTTLFHPLSVPGLGHIMRCLALAGTNVFSLDLAFLRRAGVDFVSGAPNHHATLLRDKKPTGAKLPLALCGGGPVRKTLASALLEHFDCLLARYSSTEAGNICQQVVTDTAGHGDMISPGKAQPPAELQIVDEQGIIVPAMTEGIVRVRSPCLVRGYIGAQEEGALALRDGWFYPGDVGYLSETGDLFVTGRVADQLNIGGVKLNPDLVDTVIHAAPGVRDGACFARLGPMGVDELAAAIVLDDQTNTRALLLNLHAAVIAKVGPSRAPRLFYLVDNLPLNQNGKVLRRALQEATRNLEPIDLGARY